MSARRSHGTLLRIEGRRLSTTVGEFRAEVFRNLSTRLPAVALLHGDLAGPAPLLARVHSSCVTSEIYGGCDCDCAEQLAAAFRIVASAGRGVIFYLLQEGRGAGFAAKARDRMLVQSSGHRLTTFEAYRQMGLGADQRRYDEVAWMREMLAVDAPFELLSSNPEKAEALARVGVAITRVRPLPGVPTPWNRHYIAAKSRSGHSLERPARDEKAAELPESVESYEPRPLPGLPRMVDVASYLLPVRFGNGEPAWFRVHVYFDLGSGAERVVITHRRDPRSVPLATVQEDSLFDRFSPAPESATRRRWREAAREIISAGAGAVLFRGAQELPGDDLAAETARARDAETGLLASHLPGGRARLAEADAWLAPGLAGRGVRVELPG